MKIFEGLITSIATNNTATVEVTRRTPHPLYGKLIKRSKKYSVDTRGFDQVVLGERVKISETKPMSKNKYFKVTEIVIVAKRKTATKPKEEKTEEIKKPVKTTVKKVKKESKK